MNLWSRLIKDIYGLFKSAATLGTWTHLHWQATDLQFQCSASLSTEALLLLSDYWHDLFLDGIGKFA